MCVEAPSVCVCRGGERKAIENGKGRRGGGGEAEGKTEGGGDKRKWKR